MSNVIYLASANRTCPDCNCTRAVSNQVAKRTPAAYFTPTRACGDCGDLVEVDTAPLESIGEAPAYVQACDDCGSTEHLLRAEINLPEGMGVGYVRLCSECVALYDEGGEAWAR